MRLSIASSAGPFRRPCISRLERHADHVGSAGVDVLAEDVVEEHPCGDRPFKLVRENDACKIDSSSR